MTMKATGIVRRIDSLGRIVIPKEIRRNLRLQANDPMEILVEEDRVIFQKYSPLDVKSLGKKYADVLSKLTSRTVAVCDTYRVVTAFGSQRHKVQDQRISNDLEALIRDRQSFVWDGKETNLLKPVGLRGIEAIAALPIVAQGDLYGALVVIADDAMAPISEQETPLLTLVVELIEKDLEL